MRRVVPMRADFVVLMSGLEMSRRASSQVPTILLVNFEAKIL